MTASMDLREIKFSNGHKEKAAELRDDFGKLLKAWQASIARSADAIDSDSIAIRTPWAVNERTNVSLLAGAAWSLANGCALEEFAAQKRLPDKKGADGRSRKKNGRVDLYIRVGTRKGFACEAKHVMPLISSRASIQKSVQAIAETIESAWQSTQQLKSQTAAKRYALTFVSPRFKPGKSEVSGTLEEWLEAVRACLNGLPRSTAYAWIFPAKWRQATGPRSGAYPGVMLVVQRQYRR